jgi:hypothetical protein
VIVSPAVSPPDRAAALTAQIAAVGLALPGTLIQRHTRCGRSGCHCHADPPVLHGPYWQWTRKSHGKTITRLVPDDLVADDQHWLDNHRRLRELIAELEELTLAVADERSGRPDRRRRNRQTAQNTVDSAR